MKLIISAKDFKLTSGLTMLVTKKMTKIERLVPVGTLTKVELDHDHNQRTGLVFRAELSVQLGRRTIKAGQKGETINAVIDLSLPKLIEQIVRHKEKRLTVQRRSARQVE